MGCFYCDEHSEAREAIMMKVGDMKAGTLYPLLHGLEEKGLVTAYEQEAAAGKPRRYYHLTDQGHAALREKETSWNIYARAVGKVLKGGACCAGA